MAVGVVAALVAVVVFYYTWQVVRARSLTPGLISEALSSDRLELSMDDLSAEQLQALLAVQDPNFLTHKGWDFSGGTMTTITQALVKRLYFESFRPGLPKIRQSLIARFALDPMMSKQDQLKLFINTVWLARVDGTDVVGLAAGARAFHGKEFRDLSWDEYLSMLIFDAPCALNPHANPGRNARRVRQIKRLLAGECERPGLFGKTPNCWSEDPA